MTVRERRYPDGHAVRVYEAGGVGRGELGPAEPSYVELESAEQGHVELGRGWQAPAEPDHVEPGRRERAVVDPSAEPNRAESSVAKPDRAPEPSSPAPGHAEPAFLLLNGCALACNGWDEVVAPLEGRKIIAVDRPGRRPSRAAGVFSLASEVAFLQDLAEEEGGRMVIIAHSMAAFQAEALARLRPGLVAGLVLVDPSVASPRARALRSAAPMSRAAGRLLRLGPVRQVTSALWRAGLKASTVRPEVIDGPAWRMTWHGQTALATAAAESLSYSGQAAELMSLRRAQSAPADVPAVVLEARPFMSDRARRAMLGAFAAVSIHRVPGSRHLMMLDAPRLIAHHALQLAALPQKS